MFYHLKVWYTWLRRWRCCRGFGVQSPSAYGFIRYVVNEHYPYYAYEELRHQLAGFSSLEHKYGRLLLRIANYWQPVAIFCAGQKYFPYLNAGCRTSKISLLSQESLSFPPTDGAAARKKLIVLDWTEMINEDLVADLLPQCDANTLLVVLGLHINKEGKQAWRKIMEASGTGRTYGLYYAGIAFFDKSLHKQHYEVNF